LNWTAFQAEARSIAEISALTGDVFDFLDAVASRQGTPFRDCHVAASSRGVAFYNSVARI
jgi:hypothetical protein